MFRAHSRQAAVGGTGGVAGGGTAGDWACLRPRICGCTRSGAWLLERYRGTSYPLPSVRGLPGAWNSWSPCPGLRPMKLAPPVWGFGAGSGPDQGRIASEGRLPRRGKAGFLDRSPGAGGRCRSGKGTNRFADPRRRAIHRTPSGGRYMFQNCFPAITRAVGWPRASGGAELWSRPCSPSGNACMWLIIQRIPKRSRVTPQ